MSDNRYSSSDSRSSSSDSEAESEGELLQHKDEPRRPESNPLGHKKWRLFLGRLRKCNWWNLATIACLLLTYSMVNVSFSILPPFFPTEAEDRGASALMVGIIMSCTPLTLAISSPLCGYLLPLIGITTTIFLGILLVGATCIVLAFVLLVPTTWGFVSLAIVLRIVQGIGSAMFVTGTYAILPLLFPNCVSTIVAQLEIAAGVGFAVGAAVGGALFEVGGKTAPFIAMGSLVLVLVIPCGLMVKKLKLNEKRKEILPIKVILRIVTSLPIILVGLAMVTSYSCTAFFEVTIEPFFKGEFSIPNNAIALILSIGALSNMITALVLGPVVDRIGYSRLIIIIGISICTFSFLLVSAVRFIGRWYILVCCMAYLITGIGAAFSVVPAYSNILITAKSYASTVESKTAVTAFVSGIISSSLYLGEFAGSIIGGLLTDHLTYSQSGVVFIEIALAELLLLIGVTIIDKYTTTVQPQKMTKKVHSTSPTH